MLRVQPFVMPPTDQTRLRLSFSWPTLAFLFAREAKMNYPLGVRVNQVRLVRVCGHRVCPVTSRLTEISDHDPVLDVLEDRKTNGLGC